MGEYRCTNAFKYSPVYFLSRKNAIIFIFETQKLVSFFCRKLVGIGGKQEDDSKNCQCDYRRNRYTALDSKGAAVQPSHAFIDRCRERRRTRACSADTDAIDVSLEEIPETVDCASTPQITALEDVDRFEDAK